MHWHTKTAGQSFCVVLACALCVAPYLYLYVQRSEQPMSYAFSAEGNQQEAISMWSECQRTWL